MVYKDYRQVQLEGGTSHQAQEERARLLESAVRATGFDAHFWTIYGEDMLAEPFPLLDELNDQGLKKHPELSQLLYEDIMATNPPEWLKQKQEQKYWIAVGGPESNYCKQNGCGMCIKLSKMCD